MAGASKKRKKKILPYIFIFVGSVVLSLLLYITFPIQLLEKRINDELFVYRGPIPIEDTPIVLVAISDQADGEIPHKWPWPTDIHARLVNNLTKAGARVIVFDVLFSNPDPNPANDSLFAQAIKEAGNVILAADFDVNQQSLSSQQSIELPNAIISEGNNNPIGIVNMLNDIDGYTREYRFGGDFIRDTYYMMAFEALRVYEGSSTLSFTNTASEFGIGDYLVQKTNPNSFIINYHGPNEYFPVVSYEEVIDDSTFKTQFEIDAEFDVNAFDDPYSGLLEQGIFKDKIVIIGATMTTLQDYHLTPFATSEDLSGEMAGYEIHANALQSILSGNNITKMEGWHTLLIIFLVTACIVFFNRMITAKRGIIIGVLLIAGYLYLGYYLFVNNNYFIIFTAPILAVIFSEVGTVVYEYFDARKERFRIQSMFQSYVSPKLVKQMVESEEEPKLGGEEHVVTAFFSDIASFSAFSEKLPAQQLVTLINEYLTEMTNILTDEGGTLDKYIGDAIVAIFGAPVNIADHAYRACIVSQLMQRKQLELQKKWAKEDWPDIVVNMRTRIGLNTGEMVTGNMGSNRRFNYTMMGDNVNLAARCESGAKSYGVYTMVTEATKLAAEEAGDRCVFRYLDKIVVVGRTQAVRVFEVVGLKEYMTDREYELISTFEEGTEAYLNEDWDTAIAKFEASSKLETHQPGEPGIKTNPSLIYLDRCNTMKDAPSIPDWDGVFKMTSK